MNFWRGSNFMVDPQTLRCTALIDLVRLGVADRCAGLTLALANAEEIWTSDTQADAAFRLICSALKIEAPDKGRLAFCVRLASLTWG